MSVFASVFRLAPSFFLPVLLMAFNSACGPIAEDVRAPAAPPMPAAYGGVPQSVGMRADTQPNMQANTLPASAIGWQDFFADDTLRDLIGRALLNNRDLRVAMRRVDEARASYGIRRADSLPALNASVGMDRLQVPAGVSPTGKTVLADSFRGGVAVMNWEIDFWGRIRSLNEAALQAYLATDEARRAASLALIEQVANTYLAVRELDERALLAQRTVDSQAQTFQISRRRAAVGAISRLNLTQVESLLNQAQTLGAQIGQARDAEVNALDFLVGEPSRLPAASQTLETTLSTELRAGLPSDLLINRPDIIAAEHQLRAADADIAAARAAFFPRITLTAALGTLSPELTGLFALNNRGWLASPAVALPLLDGNRRQNNLLAARARREIATAAYDKTIQAAFRQVADALSAVQWLRERVGLAQAALANQTERARLASRRFDSGAASYLEVLDAQRDRLAAEQTLVQVRRSLLSSRVSLYIALGGGADAHIGDPVAPAVTQ